LCKPNINNIIGKNLFGFYKVYPPTTSVIHKSYKQVLTPVNNLQLLLRLPILDMFRLLTFHLQATQRNYKLVCTGFRRNESSHDLDSSLTVINNVHCCVSIASRQR
jgi:hypothetical protein